MATRLKTIEYATSTNVITLASATKRTLTGSTQIFDNLFQVFSEFQSHHYARKWLKTEQAGQ